MRERGVWGTDGGCRCVRRSREGGKGETTREGGGHMMWKRGNWGCVFDMSERTRLGEGQVRIAKGGTGVCEEEEQ